MHLLDVLVNKATSDHTDKQLRSCTYLPVATQNLHQVKYGGLTSKAGPDPCHNAAMERKK